MYAKWGKAKVFIQSIPLSLLPHKNTFFTMSPIILFKLLGSLALLMFGMKLMSESLQKMAGSQLRHVLGTMTKNRFTGMLTGVFVTASVQSSTATTIMTVSFVNAGLLTLAQAISVIMGANIGTTLTAWIIAAGATFNITDFVYPAFFIAVILIYSKRRRSVGDFIFGVAFMILGLGTLRQTGIDMHLGEQQVVLNFFSSFDPNSFLTTITFLFLGSLLTMSVQSSAAVMAITMILCSSGVLPIYQGIALVMGENIGTTVTSNIIALSANVQARRAALAHMFFNFFGVIWVLSIFHPFVDMVCMEVGFEPTMVMQMNLAIEEAVVNVMSYAYPVGTVGNVNIEAQADDERLKFTIVDNGIPFDPTAKAEVDITLGVEERPIGGLGIHLVRQLMDSINYERIDGKNVLTLRKKIDKPSVIQE